MKKLLAFILSMVIGSAYAANGILINEFVKAGVNELTGTLGSGGNTSPGLLYDNTGTGTFNTSYDYLTPGSPFDGFTVRLEDSSGTLIRTYTNNNAGNARAITGSWIGSTSASSAIWSGTNSDFDIQNTYSLPSGQKYIDIDTQITANIVIPKLWFGRFIDPDARAAAGDSSATDNVLGYGAIPRYNVAFSEAIASRYALGLYSSASNVRAGISQWSTDPKAYYANNAAGYGSYTDNTYGQGDDTIGLGFLVENLAVGDIVNFRYAYIFGPSAFGAATSAVDGGAGGGTPGTVPGGGTLTDVGSATDADASGGSSTPTVVSTSTSTITISSTDAVNINLPVVIGSIAHHEASYTGGIQLIARETRTTTTTPMVNTLVTKERTTSTWSDSTTTYVDATPVSTETLWNDVSTAITNDSFSGRIDQQEKLATLNVGMNRSLNSDAFRKDLIESGKGRMFLIGNKLNSNMSNGYDANSDRFGIGFEKDVKDNWILGVQYNRVNTIMKGIDSDTKQGKNHFGLYSIVNKNDWILKTDLAIADNNITSNRNVENLFFNASKTNGKDIWLSNRLYTPEMKGFRPYAGVTLANNKRDGYEETGSIQTYRRIGKVSGEQNYAELGLRYERRIDKLTLAAEGGITTDNYKDAKGSVAYSFNKNSQALIYVTRQTKDDLSTNTIGITGRIDF
jgi:hypothetical protein